MLSTLVLSLLTGYLLGSVLPAYLLGRLYGFDIRERGTGNPGISNAARVLGYPAAVLTAVYDLGKAQLAVIVALWLGAPLAVAYVAGAAAVAGHRLPFYLGFRGGEGNAAAVAIAFYAIVRLVLRDWHTLFLFAPILVAAGLIFFLRFRRGPAGWLIFGVLPVLILTTLPGIGMNVHSVALWAVALYIIGQRLARSLGKKYRERPEEERRLLRRKWLRPLATLFPLGMFYSRPVTLWVLGAVFAFFVVFEILRFRSKYHRFLLPYKPVERTRISSMVMFLFAALLVLRFFPTGIATLTVLFTIFGDLLAWAVGTVIAGPGFLGKTWSGTAACLVTCLILAALYQSLHLVPLPVGALGAVTATALEVAPIQDDNFIMPMAGAVVMTIVSG